MGNSVMTECKLLFRGVWLEGTEELEVMSLAHQPHQLLVPMRLELFSNFCLPSLTESSLKGRWQGGLGSGCGGL